MRCRCRGHRGGLLVPAVGRGARAGDGRSRRDDHGGEDGHGRDHGGEDGHGREQRGRLGVQTPAGRCLGAPCVDRRCRKRRSPRPAAAGGEPVQPALGSGESRAVAAAGRHRVRNDRRRTTWAHRRAAALRPPPKSERRRAEGDTWRRRDLGARGVHPGPRGIRAGDGRSGRVGPSRAQRPPARSKDLRASAARSATRSAARGRSVTRSTASLAHTGSGGTSPRATSA